MNSRGWSAIPGFLRGSQRQEAAICAVASGRFMLATSIIRFWAVAIMLLRIEANGAFCSVCSKKYILTDGHLRCLGHSRYWGSKTVGLTRCSVSLFSCRRREAGGPDRPPFQTADKAIAPLQ